ncbi:MAG TPA: Crp/Fnr family transcriptional regulator [Bacteroidales bacterium]|nr:Crp/Fnr family transcriptional regulator [Bacteroidales bacterium]HPI85889.1 Crp/Fnr family transcriptional regulator [Bacteroidales bacterium]HPM92069.1 Crp/Fnr family transcriptional regulator [Bacteroidales bacterium]
MYQALINSPIFTGLSEEELEKLFQRCHCFTKNYEVGDIAAFSGEPVNFLIIVLEGSVKGEMVDFSGKIIKIDDIRAPYPLASAFIFGKQNKFPVNVMANERTKLLYIPKYDFMKMLQADIRLMQNFLNVISGHTQILANKLKFLSFKTIKGKIAQYLLSLAGPDKDLIELPLTQSDLAEQFGVTRPSLARALGEMADEGMISVDRKVVRILDRRRLLQIG